VNRCVPLLAAAYCRDRRLGDVLLRRTEVARHALGAVIFVAMLAAPASADTYDLQGFAVRSGRRSGLAVIFRADPRLRLLLGGNRPLRHLSTARPD
jgi:hypothetical protein